MKLNGKLIDAVTVERANCKDEKYIERLKSNLRQKWKGLIVTLEKQPVFYLYIASNESF